MTTLSASFLGRNIRKPQAGIALAASLAFFCNAIVGAEGATLRYAGVFGNSGEEGETLVRFAPGRRAGLGVIYDRYGTLWDRAGDGQLNRYTLDGRFVAAYPIGKSGGYRDSAALVGDHIFLSLGGRLQKRSIEATPEDLPDQVPVAIDRMSRNSHDGWVVAAKGGEVFLVNGDADTKPIASLEGEVSEVSFGPEGRVFGEIKGKPGMVRRDVEGAPAHPWIGSGTQWMDAHWYSYNWHGTMYRYSPDFQRDPGVVLGGNSGAFIGRVEANYEISLSPGSARIANDLFAISGFRGVVHLMNWHHDTQRFTIVRRIGAVPECSAMALDSQGRLWWGTGVWEWSDGPDAPLKQGVPADETRCFGAVVLDTDWVVTTTYRYGRPHIFRGPLTEPMVGREVKIPFPKNGAFSTVIPWAKGSALVIFTEEGKGLAIPIGPHGHPAKEGAEEVVLTAATPVKQWTSLFMSGNELLGSADGQVIRLLGKEKEWQEKERWNRWGDRPDETFGDQIYTAVNGGRLWVADTTRHRVLCFDLATRQLLATFGTTDQAGDSTQLLNRPELIVANGLRAVVYDTKNQRLVKMELIP